MEGLEERLQGALRADEDVLVAYLFGSVARGRAGPLSDVDVAFLLASDGDPFPRFLEIVEEVAGLTQFRESDRP